MTNIILRGGLGNQMFQYALLLALRNKGYKVICNTSLYNITQMHNGYELDRVFGVNEKVQTNKGVFLLLLRLLCKLKPNSIYTQDNGIYNGSVINNPTLYIDGYWQDERYFNEITSLIRNVFSFKGVDERNAAIADSMNQCNSVSLHIRRGDYAAYGMSILGEEYYYKAICEIIDRVENPIFYIFSDDTYEAERIAKKFAFHYEIMNHNHGNDSYKDMYLMSRCKYNIIANSSFSWWGAWLNEYSNKIIVAPSIWDQKHPEIHPQIKDWLLI